MEQEEGGWMYGWMGAVSELENDTKDMVHTGISRSLSESMRGI